LIYIGLNLAKFATFVPLGAYAQNLKRIAVNRSTLQVDGLFIWCYNTYIDSNTLEHKMFKKILTGLVISAIISPAFSAQDVYLTFKDGKSVVYKNLPDSVDNAQFTNMVMRDYGRDFNTDVDASKSRVVDTPSTPVQEEVQTSFWDSNTGKIIKWTAVAVVVYYGIKALPVVSKSNPCVLPTDRARDGSLCGGRASSVRPGGR
jgi:hypothetical protein